MLKKGLLAVLSLITVFLPFYALAQTFALKGRVLAENNSPLGAITVLVINASDSALVKTAVSDKNGNYEAELKQSGDFLIAASFLNQKTFVGPFTIDQRTFLVPDLIVKTGWKNLKEVVIREKNPFIEQKPGKTVLNIGKSSLASGNNALDILRRAPGVHLDDNENIILKGKSGALITIDGKPGHLSPAETAELLRNTASEAIELIELISNPSARYEAAGVAGVINIQLKKGKNVGTNGSFTSGLGYGDHYKANSGLNLNHRSAKLNLFGSYNYGNQKRPETVSLYRSVGRGDKSTRFEVNNNDEKVRASQSFKAGADLSLNSAHTVGILINGNFGKLSSIEENSTLISSNAVLDSNIRMFSDDQRTTRNSAYNINYKGLLDTSGKTLSIDFDYFTYTRRSSELLENNFLDDKNIPYRETLRYRNNSPSQINIQSVKTDYTHPLSKRSTVEAGVKISKVKNTNERLFQTQINDKWIKDVTRSDEFNFSETITAGYLSFKTSIGNKTDLDAGLRAEHTETRANSLTLLQKADRKYLDLFPAFQLSHRVNGNNKLHFSFSRRINRPYYEDLNPFIYFLDQYHYREGNPYLKPEYSSSVEIGHLYKDKFSTTLKYAQVKDIFLSFYEQNDDTGVTIASRKNLNSQQSVGLVLSAPVDLTGWWSANCDLEANYMRFTYKNAENDLDHQSPYFTLNAANSFDLKKGITAELLFNYQSATYYGLLDWEPVYFVDIGLNKSLLKNRASLKLSLTDVFNTNESRYSILYQNMNMAAIEKTESRIARINFSYRFGKSTVKPARKRNTGSAEESRRIRN